MNEENPLRFARGGKMHVKLTAEEMFGNRRWVRDADGRLVERFGPPREGDDEVLRTIAGDGSTR